MSDPPHPLDILFRDQEAVRSRCIPEGTSSVVVLDVCQSNALLFSQGDWRLVRRDLETQGVPSKEVDRLEAG
jgi:hypothetical protein